MIIAVLGPNDSGKSAFAEALAARINRGRLVYIATMIPYGEEGRLRVQRHREQRQGAGFITMELPQNLRDATLLPNDTLLLEDASNLTANMLFNSKGNVNAKFVLQEISLLSKGCAHLIIVSITGLKQNNTYDEATNCYIEILGRVNKGLWNLADTVYQMEQGEAILRKGIHL